jgi:hypothetical protein
VPDDPMGPGIVLVFFYGFKGDAITPSTRHLWWPQAATGNRYKKKTWVKNEWSRCLFRFLFAHGPAWWLLHSGLARNWSSRPATVPLPWSKASKIKGEGPR